MIEEMFSDKTKKAEVKVEVKVDLYPREKLAKMSKKELKEVCKELNLDRSAFSKSLIKFEGNVDRALEHYKGRKKRTNS